MAVNMSEGWIGTACIRQRNRWMFNIPGVSDNGVSMLPPLKSARPSVSFKEFEAQHLNETIFFPGKPEWKPISVTLYDIKRSQNPVFEWLKLLYNPLTGTYNPSVGQAGGNGFKKTCSLELYNGCGEIIERWTYENAWPQSIEFGELDMSSSEIITVDLSLRYDRAFLIEQPQNR